MSEQKPVNDSADALKPCPFCGAAAVKIRKADTTYTDEAPDDVWDIQCGTEGCYLEHGADWWLPLSEVSAKWNKRHNKN